MACFVAPVVEAIAVTVAVKAINAKNKNAVDTSIGDNAGLSKAAVSPFLRKLKWLSNLLWGGSFLLAFEHLWHGEIVPWFPFLTAASDSVSRAEMLREIATVGVLMSVLVTAVWVCMVLVSNAIEKKSAGENAEGETA